MASSTSIVTVGTRCLILVRRSIKTRIYRYMMMIIDDDLLYAYASLS